MSGEQKTSPSQFEKVKAITDQLEAGIQALFESEKFQQYLKILSKFHDYSLNNTLLIAMQKPDATLVAGYTAWKKQFGRQVQKGESGIRILAPTPYKKKMAGVILLMLSSSALTMAIPIFFQNVMDHSIPEKDMKSITFYSIATLLIALYSGISLRIKINC